MGSDAISGMIRAQLDHCVNNHPDCTRSLTSISTSGDNTAHLPTRLLQLGPLGDSDEDLRLVMGRDVFPCNYITLSYTWGVITPFMLTEENLEQCFDRIKFANLNKTYQHAVTFARQLGYRYLWIDSICMKQLGTWSHSLCSGFCKWSNH